MDYFFFYYINFSKLCNILIFFIVEPWLYVLFFLLELWLNCFFLLINKRIRYFHFENYLPFLSYWVIKIYILLGDSSLRAFCLSDPLRICYSLVWLLYICHFGFSFFPFLWSWVDLLFLRSSVFVFTSFYWITFSVSSEHSLITNFVVLKCLKMFLFVSYIWWTCGYRILSSKHFSFRTLKTCHIVF